MNFTQIVKKIQQVRHTLNHFFIHYRRYIMSATDGVVTSNILFSLRLSVTPSRTGHNNDSIYVNYEIMRV